MKGGVYRILTNVKTKKVRRNDEPLFALPLGLEPRTL